MIVESTQDNSQDNSKDAPVNTDTAAQKRVRLKRVHGVTVDSATSMDLDDAVWLEREGELWVLTISVADVSRRIRLGSPAWERALRVGETLYYNGGSAPMLPRSLSEDLCSLLPQKSRLAVAVRIAMRDDLLIESVNISRVTLKSAGRYDYQEVARLAEKGSAAADQPHAAMFQNMALLATAMLANRRTQGALAVYDVKDGWAMTEDGNVVRLGLNEANIGFVVVQEFMIAANRAVAQYVTEKDIPTLYRNHKARVGVPDRESLMRDVEEALRYPTLIQLNTLQERLKMVMGRANYGPNLEGHFGLNLPAYCHFTSPIRRLADLVLHFNLVAHLEGKDLPFDRDALAAIGLGLQALADERIDKAKRKIQEQKNSVEAQNLPDTTTVMATVSASNFTHILERSVMEGEIGSSLVNAIALRVEGQCLTPKHIFLILFCTPDDVPGWMAARRTLMDHLAANPPVAVSVLDLSKTIPGWPPVEYAETGTGTDFRCEAFVLRDGVEVRSRPVKGTTKKQAQRLAALDLCARLSRTQVTSKVLDVFPVAQGAKETKTVHREGTAGPKNAAVKKATRWDFDGVALLIRKHDYVSALSVLCQKASSPMPEFAVTISGEDHAPSVTCDGTVLVNDMTLAASVKEKNARRAKHAVAERLLNQIRAQTTEEGKSDNDRH